MSSNCSSNNSFSSSFQSLNDLKALNNKDTNNNNNNTKQIEQINENNKLSHLILTDHFNQKQSNVNSPSNSFLYNNKQKLNSNSIKKNPKTIFQKLAQRNMACKLDSSNYRGLNLSSKSSMMNSANDGHFDSSFNELPNDYDND